MSLPNKLEKLHQRNYAYLVGSGTAGLYAILKALGLKNALVGIPNNVCMNVVLAVKFSNNQPVYLDVSKDNLGLSPTALANCSQKLQAVIAVHAYGAVCDIEEIVSVCQAKDIFLIEDAAVAQGAIISGKPVGSFGDVSILSFGSGKIIEVGHGGAILTNDNYLLGEIIKIEGKMPPYSEEAERKVAWLDRHFTKLYNDFYGTADLSAHAQNFNLLALETKAAFLFRFDSAYAEKIEYGMAKLEENIATRQNYADFLADKFSRYGVTTFQPPAGSVFWRDNIFLENSIRDSILRKLLHQKYNISSWFPSIDMFFEERSDTSVNTPVSDWIGDSILNIWVNDQIDKTYLKDISTEIIKSINND